VRVENAILRAQRLVDRSADGANLSRLSLDTRAAHALCATTWSLSMSVVRLPGKSALKCATDVSSA